MSTRARLHAAVYWDLVRHRLRLIGVFSMPDVASIVFVVDDDVSGARIAGAADSNMPAGSPRRLHPRRIFCPARALRFHPASCSM
jgi:hypothetical protein